MAISKGQESIEGASFKRYIGVAPCFVKSVNPTKNEMASLLNTEVENEPIYVSEVEVEDRTTGAKEKVKNARITFFTQPDPEKCGEIPPISVTMFLQKRYRYNSDKSKVQVIDKYGRTAWVTIEQGRNHEIPMYSNGPANLDKDYRPAYVGEEDLTNFLIAYLNIPSPMRFNQNDRKWYMVEHPEDSECRLDNIENLFKGDFKELREAISLQPNNKVKILFGVRTNNEGKQYQAAYTNMFLKNNVRDYNNLDKNLQERKSNGAYSTTEFEICDLKEYDVASTKITETVGEMPFDIPSSPATPW